MTQEHEPEGEDSRSWLSSASASFEQFIQRVAGDWPQRDRLDEPAHPAMLGKFTVIREIGRGTFGYVFLVRDPDLDCLRAVKVPTNAVLTSPRLSRKFLEDAVFAVRLDHPNVVRVHEARQEDFPYFVMEYCPDGSLSGWLKGRGEGSRLKDEWAANLVAQIADGVHHIHLQKIIHRDLKPANILLSRVGARDERELPDFCPKVADFGLAKLLEDPDATCTVGSGPVGTIAYMSPEQTGGREGEICEVSDVYALGSILFELVSGVRPYTTKTPQEILDSLRSDEPSPSLRQACPGVSRDIELVVSTAMNKDPLSRYATAAEMAEDLRRLVRGDAPRGASLGRKAKAWLVRNRNMVASLLLLAVLAATAYSVFDSFRASTLIQRIRSADTASLPGLVAQHGAKQDPRIEPDLKALFEDDRHPQKQVAAAVMRSGYDKPSFDFAYRALLDAQPIDIEPLTGALNVTRPTALVEQLERDAANEKKPEKDAEAHDRRRANAASALALLGRTRPAMAMLKWTPDPQARSFLIHTLGPSGIHPSVLLDALSAPDLDVSVRRALLQAMGEIPASTFRKAVTLRVDAIARALSLYRDDPDPGVHASAKWLLTRWERWDELIKADLELRGPYKGERRWRINLFGMTFVQVRDPKTGRPLEVSDTEVTVRQYGFFNPTHEYDQTVSPSDRHPMNGVDYCDAARFLNWLGLNDPDVHEPPMYVPAVWNAMDLMLPIPERRGKGGYRVLTDREFRIASEGGSDTRRFYGDCETLLAKYVTAGRMGGANPWGTQPSGSLKPNEFGIFDGLGSVEEFCEIDSAPPNPPNPTGVTCGGCWRSDPDVVRNAMEPWSLMIFQKPIKLTNLRAYGFRVARTIR